MHRAAVVKRRPPYEFVLDLLAPAAPRAQPMFGCVGIYVGDRFVLVLRERDVDRKMNGVWVPTTFEHHESLRRDFPSLRPITEYGTALHQWLRVRATAADFEATSARICRLILAGDPRIGRVPAKKAARKSIAKKSIAKRNAKKSATRRSRP